MAKLLLRSGVSHVLVPGRSAALARRPYSAIYEDVDVFKGTAEAARRVRIDGYDEGGFHVNGTPLKGSVVCLSSLFLGWSPATFEDITTESLCIFELLRPGPEILILGCGKQVRMLGQDVRDYLRKNGIRVEAVDSRNAASTFNFLNEEGRQVAAALLPTAA